MGWEGGEVLAVKELVGVVDGAGVGCWEGGDGRGEEQGRGELGEGSVEEGGEGYEGDEEELFTAQGRGAGGD